MPADLEAAILAQAIQATARRLAGPGTFLLVIVSRPAHPHPRGAGTAPLSDIRCWLPGHETGKCRQGGPLHEQRGRKGTQLLRELPL